MSRVKSKGKNFNAETTEQHDKIFEIDAEMRKELNNPKGWVTGGGKPMITRKISKGKSKKKETMPKVDNNSFVVPTGIA